MEIIEKGDIEKALNVEKKNPYGKNPRKTIYEVIKEYYLDKKKLKWPKDFLMKWKAEFNAPQLIPLDAQNKIQRVDFEYGLFSQIVKIKI